MNKQTRKARALRCAFALVVLPALFAGCRTFDVEGPGGLKIKTRTLLVDNATETSGTMKMHKDGSGEVSFYLKRADGNAPAVSFGNVAFGFLGGMIPYLFGGMSPAK